MRTGLVRLVLICFVSLAAADRVPAELIPTGTEFQANTYTLSSQRYPSVALDTDFDFVIVWESYGRDGHTFGVFGRRYDSTGAALGDEFQVNSYTPGAQVTPAVTLAANGDFVVAWTSMNQDGSSGGVFARRFTSAGAPQANEFQVNSYTLGTQSGPNGPDGNAGPAIDAETNGDFVVAWHDGSGLDGSSFGIVARRFSAAGTAIASEFHVNTYTSSAQTYPTVGVDADGDFVVAWQSYAQDANFGGIFARRFASTGTAVAGEFQVNIRTFQNQRYPNVSLESNGDFVVAWQSYAHDGHGNGVVARRFASTGTGLGTEFRVNSYTSSSQVYPSVAVDADGDFVVTWHAYDQDGEATGVFAQRFGMTGLPVNSEFQVNTYTEGAQAFPAVGIDPVGDFVVAWQSYQTPGQLEIRAQRYDNVAILDIDGNGGIGALTDGILILRFMFGFTGATLVGGAVDLANCQRCDSTAIQAYMNTLI